MPLTKVKEKDGIKILYQVTDSVGSEDYTITEYYNDGGDVVASYAKNHEIFKNSWKSAEELYDEIESSLANSIMDEL